MNVAFMIYNRPELTERVFAEIAKARPERLLVVADGPKNDEERSKCEAARAVVEKIDWPCEVLRNYSDVNLGCRKRVSSGLDWVFSQVEEAIILEDDCLPDPSFFRFCEELLQKYRKDSCVGYISGDNFVDMSNEVDNGYHFSVYGGIWGWATWRRSWQLFDNRMHDWPKLRQGDWCRSFAQLAQAEESLIDMFDKGYASKVDTWDINWVFTMRVNKLYIIVPSVNLVSNIGFCEDSTHTANMADPLSNVPTAGLTFPIVHPICVQWDWEADREYEKKCFRSSGRLEWVKRHIGNWYWYGSIVRRIPIVGAWWAKSRG